MENLAKSRYTLFTSSVSSSRHIGKTWPLDDLHDAGPSERWRDLMTDVRELASYEKEKTAAASANPDARWNTASAKKIPCPTLSSPGRGTLTVKRRGH